MTGYTTLLVTATIALLVFIPIILCQVLCGNTNLMAYENTNYFVSPGYPYSNYESYSYCQWLITASSSQVVVLTLLDVQLENSTSCNFDYVAIYDGSSTNYHRIQTLCGQFSNKQFVTTGPSMLVEFHSDGSVNLKGFRASYISRTESGLCGNTSLVATAFTKYLYSPGYPNSFPSNVDCQWTITADYYSHVVLLSLVDFYLPGDSSSSCRYGSVTIYDGHNANTAVIQDLCGQYVSTQFMSTGLSMTVVFHSDYHTGYRGFKFEYTSQPESDMCKHFLVATLSATNLTSPGYPILYQSNINCLWSIHADISSRVVLLKLMDLYLEDSLLSSDCIHDYVSIYDGDGTYSTQIKRLCGQYTNTQFISTGPSMTVMFHSDGRDNYRGFKFEYISYFQQAQCINVVREATTTANYLTSPGYPNSYTSNTDCQWVIKSDTTSSVVVLTLLDFDVEMSSSSSYCSFDYVSIYDGNGTSSPIILNLCGLVSNTQFTSNGSYITVVFHSDGSGNHRGFKFEYTSKDQCTTISYVTATSSVQYFTSPYYPRTYSSNTYCVTVIVADSPSRVVSLKVLDFQLESSESSYCNHDYVHIHYDDSQLSPVIQDLCGQVTNTQFTSTSRYMTVVFKSDESYNYRGFKFEYTSTALCTNSSITATSYVEYFTSPYYPSNYLSDMDCEWRIAASSMSQSVVLDLVDFYLEASPSCFKDYVSIYDGNNTNSPLIRKLCDQAASTQFRSTGQYMTVAFHSDWGDTYKGFKFEYTSHETPVTCTNSTKWAYAYTQYLSSPGYPNNYERNMACQWILNAVLDSQVIELSVFDFKLEGLSPACNNDFVSIYDGPNTDSVILQQLCGQYSGVRITSTGPYLTVVFYSDGSNTFQGFNFGYIAQTKSVSCINSTLDASSNVQNLTSPGYPSNYPSNVDCQWIIRSDFSTSVVVLNLLDFDLGWNTEFCTFDFVSIFDGPSSDSYRMQQLCVENTCDNPLNYCIQFTSSGSTMTVVFHSDGNENSKGFKFEYTSVEKSALCGNTSLSANRTDQNITSPGFPSNYLSDLDCQWILTSDVSSSVVLLKLVTLILEESALCIKDYVVIYDGNSTSDPIIYQLCGIVSNTQYASTGPYMTVVFHYDESFSLSGFRFQYTSVDKSDAYSSVNLMASSTTSYLTSPNFPGMYPINTDCQWQITADISSKVVMLELRQFSLTVYQPDCDGDNVKIYDGPSTDSYLITVLCAIVHNGTFVSSSSSMTVVFHSDEVAGTNIGFRFSYHTQDQDTIKPNTGSSNQNNSPDTGAGIIVEIVLPIVSMAIIVVIVSVYVKRRMARKRASSTQQRVSRPQVSETSLSVVDHIDNRLRATPSYNMGTQISQSMADPSDPPPYSSLNFDVNNSNTTRSPGNITTDLSPPPPYSPALPARPIQQGRTRLTSIPEAVGSNASVDSTRVVLERLNSGFDFTNSDETSVDHRTNQNISTVTNYTSETNMLASRVTPTAPYPCVAIHSLNTNNDMAPSAPPIDY